MGRLLLPSGEAVLFDDADSALVEPHSWYLANGYAKCDNPNGKGTGHPKIYMHRLIIGATKQSVVDHINGNRLDNRRGNLRLCTKWENAQNCRASGVSFFKPHGMWAAQVTHGYQHLTLGYFKTAEAATAAYQTAIKLLRGPFARELHLDQLQKAESP